MNNKSLTTYQTSLHSTSRETEESTALAAKQIHALAELDTFRDHCRGALAMQALNHAAALAAREAYCNQIAPGGASEYRKIVQAYAYRAAAELLKGEW